MRGRSRTSVAPAPPEPEPTDAVPEPAEERRSSSLRLLRRKPEPELDRLGDDVPHARSLILRTIAAALHEAGRTDEAFAAVHASADLDRVTFEQLTARQLDLQRASLEAQAASHEAQVLSAKNALLEELVTELRRAQGAEEAA